MNTNLEHIQYLAFALVVVGLVACGIGDWRTWHTLANGGTTALGLGGGILTGQKLQQMTTKGGGPINNDPNPNSKEPS